jgi:hypothetical protein
VPLVECLALPEYKGEDNVNTINTKLAKLKELGLVINDNNRDYEYTTDVASDYALRMLDSSDVGYVLGTIPSDSDFLSTVEHDVCFLTVEKHYDELTSDYYHSLHELVKGNDADAFVEYLQKLHTQYSEHGGDTVYSDMIEEITEWMIDIVKELDDIIEALAPEDIGQIQSEMAKGYSDYIKSTAPWIIGRD